jgi:hypothetical protein
MILFFCTILVVPLMILIGGLSVDLAALGQRDAKLQSCADSAVLAAASSTYWVEPEPPATEGRWELDLSQVTRFHQLNCPGAALEAPTATGQPPTVAVTLRTVSETSLLRVIGLQQLNVAAHAKAVRRNILEAERPDPGRSRLTQ